MNEKELEVSIFGANKGFNQMRLKTITQKGLSIEEKAVFIDNLFNGYCLTIRQILR